MGKQITNEKNEFINTTKYKFMLKGLDNDLDKRVYEDTLGKDSLTPEKKEVIQDYQLDVIRINERGNEDFDSIDMFIRLNQNPCPIYIDSFEFWNSFDFIDTINKIKEVAKCKFFKQDASNRMKEEELVTILAYMAHEDVNINNIDKYLLFYIYTENKDTATEYNILKISLTKRRVTNYLKDIKPKSKEEKELSECVDLVKEFSNKLKILCDDDMEKFKKLLNPIRMKKKKNDKNCFYILWLILKDLDTHVISTYKKEIYNKIAELFALIQDMKKNKTINDIKRQIRSIIKSYSK